MRSLTRRYWHGLTGASPAAAERGREGYSLWRRYWTALLGIRLPPVEARSTAGHANPLTEPAVRGAWILLPRFDRAAVRLAASAEPERLAARWDVAGWRFTVRESGPGEVELAARADRDIPATRLLPVDVATPAGDRRYFLIFVPEASGSVGVLRLAESADWFDVAVDEVVPVAGLDPGDPETREAIARSVEATPDPAMTAWAEIVAARPADDPLSRVIRDAAGD